MEREYQVNDTVVQEYFPMDTVAEGTSSAIIVIPNDNTGMLNIYQDILGLKFKEIEPSPEAQVSNLANHLRAFRIDELCDMALRREVVWRLGL